MRYRPVLSKLVLFEISWERVGLTLRRSQTSVLWTPARAHHFFENLVRAVFENLRSCTVQLYLGTAICSSAYLMILEFTNKSKTVIYDLPGYLLIGTGTSTGYPGNDVIYFKIISHPRTKPRPLGALVPWCIRPWRPGVLGLY